MRIWYFIRLLFLFLSLTLSAQEKGSNDFVFSILRQNDEIGNGLNDSWHTKIKQLSFNDKTKLSFGGSYRFQAEAFINEQFNSNEDQNDVWFLNRFQIHAHLKSNDKFELFAELNSSFINSKADLSPVDLDELNINQFFFRYHINSALNLLVGRQNMRLGSGRLMDIREGPNVRLSFDMVQLQFENMQSKLTTFYAFPVNIKKGVFDNDALNSQESAAAIYWTQNWDSDFSTDLYAIYKKEEYKTWNSGTADDNRLSIGLRHFGKWNKVKYNNEFVFQTGSFGDQNIRAWTASFNFEYPLKIARKSSIVGLKTEAISGNRTASNNTLNTFDGLYPRGAYFGRVARIGPSNLFDLHPYIDISLGRFTVEFDYVAFWRFSKEDGIYGPALTLDYPSTNQYRFIGYQVGSILNFEVNNFINLELESNIIFPGSFLIESNFTDTLFHAVLTAELKF